MSLTDKLRAAAFARDKGICAFSGLSLWLLDYGTAPFGQPDWADHIRPKSRGGKDTLDNLVCASYFYNQKKLNNSGDRSYLFQNGRPTEAFFEVHGELSGSQTKTLLRHAALTESDWYFNRCLFNLRVALANQYWNFDARRTASYWQRSAYKRLVAWRRISGKANAQTFLQRKLVTWKEAPDVQLMLSLATADPLGLERTYGRLAVYYRANADAFDAFNRAETHLKREAVLRRAEKAGIATAPLLNVLQRNLPNLNLLDRKRLMLKPVTSQI